MPNVCRSISEALRKHNRGTLEACFWHARSTLEACQKHDASMPEASQKHTMPKTWQKHAEKCFRDAGGVPEPCQGHSGAHTKQLPGSLPTCVQKPARRMLEASQKHVRSMPQAFQKDSSLQRPGVPDPCQRHAQKHARSRRSTSIHHSLVAGARWEEIPTSLEERTPLSH